MKQHTPGPWVAQRRKDGGWEIDAIGHTSMAQVFVEPKREAEGKANAALISTAPELLAQLESCLECFEEDMNTTYKERIELLIKRAKGEV